MLEVNRIYCMDTLEGIKQLDDESIDCVITSPPYWGLRDYGIDGQIGLETSPEAYVQKLVELFREIRRVLKKDGTVWLNIGDSYAGGGGVSGVPKDWDSVSMSNREKYPDKNDPKRNAKAIGLKQKDLVGIPWRVAFALQADGWWLRQDIIWAKPNPMPESVTDRCTKSHEYIFLLTKSKYYYFDNESIKEPLAESSKKRAFATDHMDKRKLGGDEPYAISGKSQQKAHLKVREKILNGEEVKRNKRSVWTVTTKSCKEAHFATFPTDLIEPMIKAGCPPNGIVLDPFMGAGTTGIVAKKFGRNFIGFELNPEYCEIARKRIFNEMIK